MQRVQFAIVIVLLCLGIAPPVSASPAPSKPLERYSERAGVHADSILAKQMLVNGRKHMANGKYRSACPLLEESLTLDATTQAKFALAQCYDETNRHARAWTMLEDIANTAKIPKHAALARELLIAIAPRVGKGIVSMPPPGRRPMGLQIHVDGAPLPIGSWRESGRFEMVLDIGEHVVMATAPRKTPWQQSFLVISHDKPVTISVPDLADDKPLPPPLTPPQPTSPIAMLLTSFGALAFTVGATAFVVGTVEQKSRSELFVPVSACLALGGVAIASSVWFWRAPAKSAKAAATNRLPLRVVATAGAGHAFATVQGHF